MILDATTKSVEILLDGAITTNQLPFTVGYVDVDQTTFAMTAVTEADGVTNDTTPVVVVSAPAAGKSRQIKFLSVFNKDTTTAVVTLQVNISGTKRIVIKVALAVGDNLSYVG